MSNDSVVRELHTGDGVVLEKLPVALVSEGLESGWLRYDDECVGANGELLTIERCAGTKTWPASEEAAKKRAERLQVGTAYLFAVAATVYLIWFALPDLKGTYAYEWLDLRPWRRVFIVYCYALWLAAPYLLWPNYFTAIGMFLIFSTAMGKLTGVGVLDVAGELGPGAVMTVIVAAMIGEGIGLIRHIRREGACRARGRVPIPEPVLAAYASGFEPPHDEPSSEPAALPEPIPCPALAAPSADQPVVISIVHGTFARDAEWAREDGWLCENLRKAFPDRRVVFDRFPWSGRNSHAARLAAGAELRARLLRHEGNLANHFVLAHSHGGTVAAYALREAELHSRIGGLVCIGTPFLLTRAVSWRKVGALVATIGSLLGLALALWVAYGNFNSTFTAFGRAIGVPADDPAAFMGLFFVILATACGLLWVATPWLDRLFSSVAQRVPVLQTTYAQRLDTSSHPPVTLFCVHDGRDEARRWLRALNRVALLPERLGLRFTPAATVLALAGILVATGYVFDWWPSIDTRYEVDPQQLPPGPMRTDYFKYRLLTSIVPGVWFSNLLNSSASAVFIASLIYVAVGLVALIGTIVAQKLLVGSIISLGSLSWYEIITSSLLRVRVLARPRNAAVIGARSVAVSLPGAGGLRHSALVSSPVVLQHVAAWIGERIGERPRLIDIQTGERETPQARLVIRVRASSVVSAAAAALLAIGLTAMTAGILRLRAGDLEPASRWWLAAGASAATAACITLAWKWLLRPTRRRRVLPGLAGAASVLIPVSVAAWYVRTIATDRLTVLVLAPVGTNVYTSGFIRDLRSGLDTLHVATRVATAPAGQMNCARAMKMGAERGTPIVVWLAPAPTLAHLARLRPRIYEEHGVLTEVPQIEDRCTTFPVQQPALAIGFSRALALLDMGSPRLAAREFERLQKSISRPGASSSYLSYYAGLAQALQHRPAAAISEWSKVLASPPLLSNRAVMFTAARRYDAALAALNAAIKSSPQDAVLHANRGNMLRETGQYEESLRSHDRALELGDDTASRAHLRGLAILDAGDEDAARNAFAASIRLDPGYAPGYLALIEKRIGLTSSDPNVVALMRSQPRDTSGMFAKARALERARRPREAVALYDAILASEPGFCAARVARAAIAHPEEGSSDRIAALKEIVAGDPDCVEAEYALGKAYAAAHQPADAIASFDRLIARNWEPATGYLARAQLYWDSRCRAEAVDNYKRALVAPGPYLSHIGARWGLQYASTNELFNPEKFAGGLVAGVTVPGGGNDGCQLPKTAAQR
jgi:tetratricopeptide (TPR) repeat protein